MSKDSHTLFPQALQAALNSLDLDLEQEIFRYKRRQGMQRASARGLLTIGASPKSESITATTSNHPNAETNSPMRLQPNLQDRALREPAGMLTRTDADAPPDAYLASSEQLLRSLADEEPRRLNRGKTPSWLNPLGLAALLLLLIAGGALAYVLNPNLWADLVRGKNEPVASTSTTQAANRSATDTTAVSAPNLAANSSFVDLSLQNLSSVETTRTLNPKPNQPANTIPVIKNPTVNAVPGTQNPQNLISALIPPSATSVTPQQPRAAQPQTSASGLPKLGRPAPNGRIYYYVLTNYNNNSSLVRGRGIARDAFIVQAPTGKKVQIATFFRKSDADALVKKLQRRGIAAQVYLD